MRLGHLQSLELWRKVGDDGGLKAAYRGGCRACQNLFERAIRHEHAINIVRLRQPDAIDDPLTEILRAGARQLLAQAIEIEAEAFLDHA